MSVFDVLYKYDIVAHCLVDRYPSKLAGQPFSLEGVVSSHSRGQPCVNEKFCFLQQQEICRCTISGLTFDVGEDL